MLLFFNYRGDMYTLLNGKELSKTVKQEIAKEVAQIIDSGKRAPALAVILVGEDPASKVYVRNKLKATKVTGMISHEYRLPADTTEEKLISTIDFLNKDEEVDGILLQLPLPKHLNPDNILHHIAPEKDVDGFTPISAGRFYTGLSSLRPCTPLGIMEFFKAYNIELEGKNAVVLGRSNIVGKPVANMLLEKNATVTICHSRTKNIKEVTSNADILILAIGRPEMIDETWVKEGAVVIDVGINYSEDGRLCGDADFDKVAPKCSAITPVPKGVGPMTIAMLMKNCLTAYKNRMK